ncbi:hypothetical protein PanWU01x14_315750 [Parasponia andersonii]|uniref:Uncharacterized protein n=1 Tax=Parasponia andersonii TaxID=3476 RepID=A0A2P5ANK5_PARAD|nr:hypothetical protein PanWU01x14_315750 [Parasponia andersonii]
MTGADEDSLDLASVLGTLVDRLSTLRKIKTRPVSSRAPRSSEGAFAIGRSSLVSAAEEGEMMKVVPHQGCNLHL